MIQVAAYVATNLIETQVVVLIYFQSSKRRHIRFLWLNQFCEFADKFVCKYDGCEERKIVILLITDSPVEYQESLNQGEISKVKTKLQSISKTFILA